MPEDKTLDQLELPREFDYDTEGRIVYNGPDEAVTETKPDETGGVVSPVVEKEPEQPKTDYEQLRNDKARLEAELNTMKQGIFALTEKVGQMIAARNQPQEPDYDWEQDLLSKEKGPEMLKSMFKKVIEESVGGINKKIEDIPKIVSTIQMQNELTVFQRKHPELFTPGGEMKKDYFDAMEPLLRKYQDMTYEEAYEHFERARKAMSAVSGEAASKPVVHQEKTEPQNSAIKAELAKMKADKLKNTMETQGTAGNIETAEPKIESVKDAFDEAWKTVFGGR